MICPNCKREVPDTAKACGYCGHWLAGETEATVQATDETGPTVALAEKKGQPPWLWIGVGLAVVILLVIVGGIAFLAGKGKGGVGTEANMAATQTAQASAALAIEAATPGPQPTDTAAATNTPAPVPTNPPLTGIPLYDDFNNPAYDGGYNQTQWRRSDSNIGNFSQKDGRLIITQEGLPGEDAKLVSREYDRVLLSTPTSFEAKLQLDPEHNAGSTFLALQFELVPDEEYWWTDCSIDPGWIHCATESDYHSDGIPPEYGQWHTLRIDVDPATMELTYYIDGRSVGSTIPPNPDDFKAAGVILYLGTWAEGEETVVGYFDEVRIGPMAAAAPPTARPTPVAAEFETELALYDDFNDPAFDGDYDEIRWRLVSDSPGDFVQEEGALVVTQETEADSATRLVARDYDFVRLEAPTAFEARLKLDSQEYAGNLHLALEAEVPEGDDWWWTECALYEDWLGCYADLGYQPEGISVTPGTWHTVRIDVDPDTMTFTYYVDGRVEGTFVPPNAERLKNADFALKVGIWHDERETGMVGYIDEVRIGGW
jgi:hypothetical protein